MKPTGWFCLVDSLQNRINFKLEFQEKLAKVAPDQGIKFYFDHINLLKTTFKPVDHINSLS